VRRICGLVLASLILASALPTLASGEDAAAQASSPPTFTACEAVHAPALPRRWHAVSLMAPFDDGQLDVGDFVYDGTIPALRASIYGAESGTIDLLVTDRDTYQLIGPHARPTGCVSLGRQYDVPSRQWLGANAQCAGEATAMGSPAEWWRKPAPMRGADWYWHRKDTRLPLRTLMTTPSRSPAVVGEYAMTYFPTFERIGRSDLSRLRDFCRNAAAHDDDHGRGISATTAPNLRALMSARRNDAADVERTRRLARLIPGLDPSACATAAPYRWPDRFAMTAIMTTWAFAPGPFAAEIFYDWTGRSQLTRLHDTNAPKFTPARDGLLTPDIGYDIARSESGTTTCQRVYPGMVRNDWMTHDQCKCRAVITNNHAFAGEATVQILSCPVKPSGLFWAWYAGSGQPLAFQSTARNPTGLNFAEYGRMEPGRQLPAGILDVPAACTAADVPKLSEIELTNRSSCSGCHYAAGR